MFRGLSDCEVECSENRGKLIRRSGIRRMGGHLRNLNQSPCEAAQSVLARSPTTFQRTLGSFSSWKGGCRNSVLHLCGKRLITCRALACFVAAVRIHSVLEVGCHEKGKVILSWESSSQKPWKTEFFSSFHH